MRRQVRPAFGHQRVDDHGRREVEPHVPGNPRPAVERDAPEQNDDHAAFTSPGGPPKDSAEINVFASATTSHAPKNRGTFPGISHLPTGILRLRGSRFLRTDYF